MDLEKMKREIETLVLDKGFYNTNRRFASAVSCWKIP